MFNLDFTHCFMNAKTCTQLSSVLKWRWVHLGFSTSPHGARGSSSYRLMSFIRQYQTADCLDRLIPGGLGHNTSAAPSCTAGSMLGLDSWSERLAKPSSLQWECVFVDHVFVKLSLKAVSPLNSLNNGGSRSKGGFKWESSPQI